MFAKDSQLKKAAGGPRRLELTLLCLPNLPVWPQPLIPALPLQRIRSLNATYG